MQDAPTRPSSPTPDLGPFPNPAPDYPIVIVQHRYCGVDTGSSCDELKWSLIILTTLNLYKSTDPNEPVHGVEMAGQSFAVAPRGFDAGEKRSHDEDVPWTIKCNRNERLSMVNDPYKKCMGGVKLGSLAVDGRDPEEVKKELEEVVSLIKSHQPTPKSEDWDYRDWLLEVVGRLREKQGARGWIDVAEGDVPDKDRVAKRMELAMHKTEEKNGHVNWKVEAEGGFVFGSSLRVTRKIGGQKMMHVPIIVGLDIDVFFGTDVA